ncbi:hypothetical protein [Actinomadura sp.]|uniref:hypothetical protein n=1 Tax=Actinomadura sp. TaxID=1989 RepID=UPI00336122E1
MASAPSRKRHWAVFAVAAALSLLLSPITAIYAGVIGALGFMTSLAAGRVIAGRAMTRPAMAFAGITAGGLPYIIAGLAI